MKTRTVALTPIKSEVADYLEWLTAEGINVLKVEWPTLPGRDVHITFAV